MIFEKHINRYYLKYLPVLLLGIASLIMVDFFQLKIPEVYRTLINAMNTGSAAMGGVKTAFDMDFLLDEICLPVLIIIVVMVIGRFLWRICFFGSGIRMETDLRSRMFERCKDLSQQYYQVNKVGTLMSLFTNDLETVQDCFGSGILMFFDALFLGILSIAKMWNMNKLLTGFALIPMVMLLTVGTLVRKFMAEKWKVRQEAFSSLSDFSQESFSGIAVVKAFVKETKEAIAFRWINKENEDANVAFTRISTLLNVFVTLFVESVICVILGYGGYQVHEGNLDAGQFVEFIGYFTAIVWPIMAVSKLIDMVSRGNASVKRIGELLDAKQDVLDRDNVEHIDEINGKIEFKDLTFRYPGAERDILKHVSFVIENGENVGIVGKTGSGKSTLVDLILRIYNVPDGALFIDDMDVNRISITDVRKAAAYVPQDNFLFSDTIANNIAFSDAEAKEDIISEMAKLADVHENIAEFKDGYQTVLGERGVTVSGGQKQRISIARALMKDAPILILDDSVSAVDTKTEKIILDNLAKTRKGKTTILIAHRISTIEKMDKIVFIDDGRIIAVGTHDRLYESCREYRKMVDMQRLEDEGDGE